MINKAPTRTSLGAICKASAICVALAVQAEAQETPQTVPLDQIDDVFAFAPDPSGDGALLLGTAYGLIEAASDGTGVLVSQPRLAAVGLETRAGEIVVSGFGEDGTPGGLLIRRGDGTDWVPVEGTAGSLALASLSFTPLDPGLVAGLGPDLRLSRNGGLSWSTVNTAPEEVFNVALSATVPGRLWAATRAGLMASEDLGANWRRAHPAEMPATAVQSLPDGTVIAFIYGTGLVSADEAGGDWQVLQSEFGARFLKDFAVGADPGTLYALADTGAVLVSRNGGREWFGFEGNSDRTPEMLTRGQQVFEDNCQACHGVRGVGEAPDQPGARDEFGFKAPALDDSMHAWHHSDLGLMATISEGSPRNERMIAWKDQLEEQDIRAVVAWLKSQWNLDAVACQGARHMACLQHGG